MILQTPHPDAAFLFRPIANNMAEFDEYIGVIARTHGMQGAVVLIDTPGIRVNLGPGSKVGVGFSRDFVRPMSVTLFEALEKSARIAFAEVTTTEDALPLVDQAVYARTHDVIVSSERYSIGEIEGCEAVTEAGVVLGIISDVWLLPANDVWVIECVDGSTIPIPVIDSVVRHVDITGRRIVVQLLEGLDQLNTSAPDDPDDIDSGSEDTEHAD